MRLQFKLLGFLTLLGTSTILSACAATQPNFEPNNIEESGPITPTTPTTDVPKPTAEVVPVNRGFHFQTNKVPSESDVFKHNYDLTFSLNFTNKSNDIYGTGWLFDWKGDEKALGIDGSFVPSITSNIDNSLLKDDQFTVYLATNLHVADALRNDQDYEPYKKDQNKQDFTENTKTEFFSLGKYLEGEQLKQYISKEENQSANQTDKALVSIQASNIPKTAYTATDFVDMNSYSYNNITTSLPGNYADFAVIEVNLNLKNQRDQQILHDFVKPAIKAYKALGDTLELFSAKPLNQFIEQNYYLLGYPVINKGNNTANLLLAQQKSFDHNNSDHNQKSQWFTKDQSYINKLDRIPVLTNNYRAYNESTGSQLFANQQNESWLNGVVIQDKGVVNFASFSNFTLKYHEKRFQQYGYGLMLNDTNFPGGSSGSPLIGKDNKLNSIYFGVLEIYQSGSLARNDIGMSQILRTPQNDKGSSISKGSYELIFGDKNTKNYYAKFAKDHQTHLYQKIKESKDEQFRFVETQETTNNLGN
ncbi:DUF31 family protein [Mycoplasmoides pneumoniae]|uniref:DUF31 family protein n=1 Tax=Mycoplasmoides pneumoniae TaxID=2104 RepID=UPI00071B2489|nr:DUF31 family protein [Mycoplasmoides pneumoniae]